jgi:hypothetical protein
MHSFLTCDAKIVTVYTSASLFLTSAGGLRELWSLTKYCRGVYACVCSQKWCTDVGRGLERIGFVDTGSRIPILLCDIKVYENGLVRVAPTTYVSLLKETVLRRM